MLAAKRFVVDTNSHHPSRSTDSDELDLTRNDFGLVGRFSELSSSARPRRRSPRRAVVARSVTIPRTSRGHFWMSVAAARAARNVTYRARKPRHLEIRTEREVRIVSARRNPASGKLRSYPSIQPDTAPRVPRMPPGSPGGSLRSLPHSPGVARMPNAPGLPGGSLRSLLHNGRLRDHLFGRALSADIVFGMTRPKPMRGTSWCVAIRSGRGARIRGRYRFESSVPSY